MKRWTLPEVAHFMEFSNSSIGNQSISGFAVDTRLLKENELFFALPGAKMHGCQFLEEAAKKGAAAAVVESNYQGNDYGLTLLRVQDPLKALQTLAANVLKTRMPKIVAVTGSLGKTTTKEFIASFLRKHFHIAVSPGNNNSQIGLPLTILNHTDGTEEVLILEMGMTEAGQIAKLSHIAPPDIAVLTKVALVHAGNFDSIEDIARAKAEIFQHSKTSLGILSRDIPLFDEIVSDLSFPIISFSLLNRDADYFWDDQEGHTRVYHQDDVVALPDLELPGKHNRHNLLAAIAVAKAFGISWHDIKITIPKLTLPERRLQHIEKKGVLFINDSYNAAEESIKASLSVLPQPPKGNKRIFIFGEIPGLGKFSENCHRAVGEEALNTVDSVICIGDACGPFVECWRNANRPIVWCHSIEEVVSHLKKQMSSGDVVLLKGANHTNLWKVLGEIE